jgi:hypothetical protein
MLATNGMIPPWVNLHLRLKHAHNNARTNFPNRTKIMLEERAMAPVSCMNATPACVCVDHNVHVVMCVCVCVLVCMFHVSAHVPVIGCFAQSLSCCDYQSCWFACCKYHAFTIGKQYV